MRFKKNIEDVLYDIELRTKYGIENEISNGYGSSINEIIAKCVAKGIKEAFRTLIENQYTDEDLEKDLGINS